MTHNITPLKSYTTYLKSIQSHKHDHIHHNHTHKHNKIDEITSLFNKTKHLTLDDTYDKELYTAVDIKPISYINNTILTTDITPKHIKSDNSLSCSHKRQSHWNTKCCCLFSYLPDELMLFNVFTYLQQSELCLIAQTCKRWKFLSSDRLLWQNIDLSKYSKKLNDTALSSLLNRHGNYLNTFKLCNANKITSNSLQSLNKLSTTLKSLHLCNVRSITDTLVSPIMIQCTQLTSLSLYGCIQITDITVQLIGECCPRLSELSLRNCSKLTNNAFTTLQSTLQGLNISGCKNISSQGIITIAQHCPTLKRLNAHGCIIDDVAIDVLTRSGRTLQTLHISSSNPFGGNPNLTDQSLEYISRLGNTIQCLNIQGASSITDKGFDIMLKQCTHLQRLNLGGCYKITDHTIYLLQQKQHKLTHLSLFQCFNVTDTALYGLTNNLIQLQHLDLHSCVGLTAQTVQALYETIDHNDNTQADTTADLTNSYAYDIDEHNHTPRSIPSAPINNHFRLPHLVSLDIGSCRNIDAAQVQRLKDARSNVNVVFY